MIYTAFIDINHLNYYHYLSYYYRFYCYCYQYLKYYYFHHYYTGWGRTLGTGGDEDVLHEIEADVKTQAECTRMWGSGYINDGHICLNNGLTGACNVSVVL